MPRSWQINGPVMVTIKFGDHCSGISNFPVVPGTLTPVTRYVIASGVLQRSSPEAPPNTLPPPSPTLCELGITSEPVRITPKFNHHPVFVDALGPDTPGELLWNLMHVDLRIPLIHYDNVILEKCLMESMGGDGFGRFLPTFFPTAPAGSPLGNGLFPTTSGNHYVSLTLTSPVAANPYRFRACYLAEQPIELPLGAEKSVALCHFRAIPYTYYARNTTSTLSTVPGSQNYGPLDPTSELVSSGLPIYDHTADT